MVEPLDVTSVQAGNQDGCAVVEVTLVWGWGPVPATLGMLALASLGLPAAVCPVPGPGKDPCVAAAPWGPHGPLPPLPQPPRELGATGRLPLPHSVPRGRAALALSTSSPLILLPQVFLWATLKAKLRKNKQF